MPSLTLDYAKAYASRGWYVLPVQGKIPLTEHGLKDATREADVIESWWGEQGKFKDANIAIRTGAESGLVVVDIDKKAGGLESYEAMKDKFPATPTVRTGGGGLHLYYRHTGGEVKNSASKIAPGIDIRGDNGYVVAPPSTHDNGNEYVWETLVSETPLADFPDILPKEQKFDAKGLFTEGKRNTTTVQLVGHMQRLGVPLESTTAAVLALDNGLSEEEKLRTIERYKSWSSPLPPRTELGQAEFVSDFFKDEIAYDYAHKSWLVWGGHRWTSTDSIFKYVVEAARFVGQKIQDEIQATGKPDTEGLKWSARLESNYMIHNITDLLKEILRKQASLDRDPYLLGVTNGVVNLATGSLLSGAPDQWITKSASVAYNPAASRSRWERFVNEIFRDKGGADDPVMVDWVWRVLGYAATGDTSKQCWFLYLGPGSNGKSTLLSTVAEVLGDYSMLASTRTFMSDSRRQASNDVAELAGKRFVYAIEAGINAELDSERVKGLTHGDKARARKLYENEFEFQPVLKLNIANNLRPRVSDLTPGFWRSVNVVPMDQRFPLDPSLRPALEAEREGILAWIIEGAQEYLKRGLFPLPPRVVQKNAEYQIDSDILSGWVNDCINYPVALAKGYGSDLWKSYEGWCIKQAIPDRDRVGRRRFGEYIYSVKAWPRGHDARGNFYEGVEIKNVNP